MTTGADDEAIHGCYLAKALADYRGGDFETAVASAKRSREHARPATLTSTPRRCSSKPWRSISWGALPKLASRSAMRSNSCSNESPTPDGGALGRDWSSLAPFSHPPPRGGGADRSARGREVRPEEGTDDESSNPGDK